MTATAHLETQPLLDALNRYAAACDTRDWALLESVFTPDATGHYRSVALSSRDSIVAFLRSRLSTCGATQHLIANHTFAQAGGQWQTRSSFRAWHQAPAPRLETTLEVFGYYDDTWHMTADGWRITTRTVSILGEVGDPAILGPMTKG